MHWQCNAEIRLGFVWSCPSAMDVVVPAADLVPEDAAEHPRGAIAADFSAAVDDAGPKAGNQIGGACPDVGTRAADCATKNAPLRFVSTK